MTAKPPLETAVYDLTDGRNRVKRRLLTRKKERKFIGNSAGSVCTAWEAAPYYQAEKQVPDSKQNQLRRLQAASKSPDVQAMASNVPVSGNKDLRVNGIPQFNVHSTSVNSIRAGGL